jgi:WD40 repeat protein
MLILKHTKTTLNCLAFSPDGKLLAAGGDRGEVQLWDAGTGTLKAKLPGCESSVNSVFFREGGAVVLAIDDMVRQWDVQLPREKAEPWPEIEHRVKASVLGPDGQRLYLSLHDDGLVCLGLV